MDAAWNRLQNSPDPTGVQFVGGADVQAQVRHRCPGRIRAEQPHHAQAGPEQQHTSGDCQRREQSSPAPWAGVRRHVAGFPHPEPFVGALMRCGRGNAGCVRRVNG